MGVDHEEDAEEQREGQDPAALPPVATPAAIPQQGQTRRVACVVCNDCGGEFCPRVD